MSRPLKRLSAAESSGGFIWETEREEIRAHREINPQLLGQKNYKVLRGMQFPRVCFSEAESLYVLDFQTFKQLPCVFARLHNRIFNNKGGRGMGQGFWELNSVVVQ